MPTGRPFTDAQTKEMSTAVARASEETGLRFSVFIGPADGDPRHYAQRLHAAFGDAAPQVVLLYVGPTERRLEIVTGRQARGRLGDRACALAGLSMSTSFAGGDLVGGVTNGLRMLADAAGRVRAQR